MARMKDRLMDIEQAIEVFGDFQHKFIISTDEENVNVNDTVTLVNNNCEFSFDNIRAVFENNLFYYYIVDLEFISADYSNYDPSKSNNAGCYAFGEFKVLKVYERTY